MVITGKTLKRRGWPQGRALGHARRAAQALTAAGEDADAVLRRLDRVLARPADFQDDAAFGDAARELLALSARTHVLETDVLRGQPVPYRVWGADQIEAGALAQMNAAMRLPVSLAGALMPDAHQGYGLPIGGVLATEDVVIPFAVGVDIACRMRLSIYPVSPTVLDQHPGRFRDALLKNTFFGAGKSNPQQPDHEVLHDPAWRQTPLLRSLQGRAAVQLGTSGSGNHFVEWGAFALSQPDPALGLEPGQYLALLSHSGSRGVGFKIANHYSKLAMERHARLDKAVKHLAWLHLDSEEGHEYMESMELAGRFASANHEVIHHAVARAAGLNEVTVVENHHNYAWRERVVIPDGGVREAIVHRKGATPAGPGVLGVIPGSMGDPGFVVRGRGEQGSLQSASHGAGRAMSRTAAINSIAKRERDQYLQARNVTLLGGGIDESPQAYKRIEEVIASQVDLVDVLGTFTPRVVRMATEAGDM